MVVLREEGYIISYITSTHTRTLLVFISVLLHILRHREGFGHPSTFVIGRGGGVKCSFA